MITQSKDTTPSRNRKIIDLKTKEAVRLHVKASIEDIDWVRTQPPCVQQLWLDCVAVEQFGGQKRELKTSLAKNAFSRARSALTAKGLFKFEKIYALTEKGRDQVVGWTVENLHGYYNKKYWEIVALESADVALKKGDVALERGDVALERGDVALERGDVALERGDETAETLAITEVENSQPRLNHVSTTHQLPTKVVGGVVGRDVSIPSEETQPPLRGAATMRDGMPEEESPQAAMKCAIDDSPVGDLPPPPQSDTVAQPPLCQGASGFAVSASLRPLDTESPAALSEDSHEGEGEGMGNFPHATNSRRANNTQPLASVTDQAEVAGEEQEDLGQDTPPAGFHIGIGDRVALDWSGSPYDGRVGVVQKLQIEAGQIEVRFEGMSFDLIFPITKVVPASLVVTAANAPELPHLTAADRAAVTGLVGEICYFAVAHDCRIGRAEREEMNTFTPKQLETVLRTLQTQLPRHSHTSSACTKKDRFKFALTMGRRSPRA